MSAKRLCAEWEPQKGVVLAFPEAHTDWAPYLEEARACVVAIAQAVAQYERVYMLCQSIEQSTRYFQSIEQIVFIEAEYNDTWMRDVIALSVEEAGRIMYADFVFNGWGAKFDATKDNKLSTFLSTKGVLRPLKSYDFILEGGAVESDGAGTLLSTTSVFMNANRNAKKSLKEVEAQLREALGVERFLWLRHGQLKGDDTDGHIDTLARFIDEQTIVYVGVPHKQDSHYESMLAMRKELESFKTQRGEPYKLVALPFVPPMYEGHKRLPATYANFLIINGAVLVPTYGVKTDADALAIFKSLFKERRVIGIDCRVLIKEHGSLHCMTMQLRAPI